MSQHQPITAVIVGAITLGLVIHAAMYGPQAAFFSELSEEAIAHYSRSYRDDTESSHELRLARELCDDYGLDEG